VRVYGWIAHLADRLRHRRSEFFDDVRARRERRGEPFRVRWYRFTDSVADRWGRRTDRYRTRRERRGEPFRGRWYRFTDSVAARWGRRTDRYRTRRERFPGYRAERFRQSVARRSSIVLGASLCVVLIIMITVLIRARVAPPAPPNAASVKPPLAAISGIDVPNVRGMPASEARAELERAGLKFAEPRAAFGPPGQVLWTQPNIGRSVPPDTSVTIVIGVEAERLGSASPVALAQA
jgi:hypothetical protein